MSAAGLGAHLVTLPWLAAHLLPAASFHPYPAAADHRAWAGLMAADRAALVQTADQELPEPWSALPASRYLEYARNGNRSRYEAIYFQRRDRARDFALAEALTDGGRYRDAAVDGLWLLCEETSWTIPAHLTAQKAGPGLPDPEEPVIDLFAAETGAQLAWTDYLLGERLDRVSPLIRPRLRAEIERRLLAPFLSRDDFGWMGARPHAYLNNWTPWILSNVLTCALLMETDPARRAAVAEKTLVILDRYLSEQPADGACDEGPGYWYRAPGSVFDVCELLRLATAGHWNAFDLPKLRALMSFPYRTQIAGDWTVNFGDAEARIHPEGVFLARIGAAVGDPQLAAYGAWAAQRPARSGGAERATSLGRELPNLFARGAVLAQPAADPLPRDSWWPQSHFVVARARAGSTDGFFLAAEALHNGKSHNHNDVGSCVVFANGEPVLIDAGVGTYTRQTFSAERYQIWTMQSAYHNLPTINGAMEAPGREHAARDVSYSADDAVMTFRADLAATYPAEADVEHWWRSYRFERAGRIVIADQFRLRSAREPVRRHFILARKPVEAAQGRWQVPGADGVAAVLALDPRSRFEVERVDTRDPRLHAVWGNAIYRLTAIEPSNALTGDLQAVLTIAGSR